jgi:hypothetical protein
VRPDCKLNFIFPMRVQNTFSLLLWLRIVFLSFIEIKLPFYTNRFISTKIILLTKQLFFDRSLGEEKWVEVLCCTWLKSNWMVPEREWIASWKLCVYWLTVKWTEDQWSKSSEIFNSSFQTRTIFALLGGFFFQFFFCSFWVWVWLAFFLV